MEIVLATRNPHKAEELKELLKDLDLKILSLSDFPEIPEVDEGSETFRKNAVKKALIVARLIDKIALADDSGLEVDALVGRPGVLSSRFAGPGATDEENNEKVLRLLKGVPKEKRKARFRCSIAVAQPAGEVEAVEGTLEGEIGFRPEGKAGFGYDPLFIVPEYGKTVAQLGRDIKNRISHRARAVEEAKKILRRMMSAAR